MVDLLVRGLLMRERGGWGRVSVGQRCQRKTSVCGGVVGGGGGGGGGGSVPMTLNLETCKDALDKIIEIGVA